MANKIKIDQVRPCAVCERPIRPNSWTKQDAPNTLVHGGFGLCSRCYTNEYRPAVEDPNQIMRPSTEQNKASLEAYFISCRPFRKALGQTAFPPYNEGFQGVRSRAVSS